MILFALSESDLWTTWTHPVTLWGRNETHLCSSVQANKQEKEKKLCFSNKTLLCYRDVSGEQSRVELSVTEDTRVWGSSEEFVCQHSSQLRTPLLKVINFPSCFSEPVLAEQVGLPHVLALREMLWDLYLVEVLDALLQLLLYAHFLFGRPFLAAAGVPWARSQSAEKITFTALFRLLLLQYRTSRSFFLSWTVQRLDVCLSANGPTDDRTLRWAGFWLALGTGGGKLIEGGAALALTLTFVPLAAAVARRRGPAWWSTWNTTTRQNMKNNLL